LSLAREADLIEGMPDANPPDVLGPLSDGERALWRGRCAVAEYAFDQAASLPRWTLPETTEVLVTNHRIRYAHPPAHDPADTRVMSGELRWLHPEHIRIQPGQVANGRPVSATQLQLVCPGADGSYPALVFAGGELGEVSDADKLANVIRHAIARFRVDNATQLGLTVEQARQMAKMLIGPEFSNREGGEGQTVTLIGALEVPRRSPSRDAHDTSFRIPGHRAGRVADETRALLAAAAEEAEHVSHPDLSTRAANVAARIAELIAGRPDPVEVSMTDQRALPSAERAPVVDSTMVDSTVVDSTVLDSTVLDGTIVSRPAPEPEADGTELTARAERVRRATARFNGNSARGKATVRRPQPDVDPSANRTH
jgi:hypothetical protein